MIATGVDVMTKTYVTLGLVILALVEFATAMHVFGRKGEKRWTKGMMRAHRIGGYIFLIYLIWPIVVGADLLTRLSRYDDSWEFHGPRFFHAMLGVTVFLLLLLKISFVRFYTAYRQSARLLGIIITVATIVTWLIAGWFFLCMMGSPVLE